MKLSRNFNSEEFDCTDGTKVPLEYMKNLQELANNLQIIRDTIKQPLLITGSGYRTHTHNAEVGGVKNSQHLVAKAADINAKGFSPRRLYNLIEKLIEQGKIKEGGLGLYPGFVHYDIRGTKARW